MCNWHADCRNVHQSCCPCIECSSWSCTFSGFPASFADLNPFHQWLYDFRSIFSHWGQLWDSNITITKGKHIYWCSRKQHDALRDAGCQLFELDDQVKLLILSEKYKKISILCSFWRAVLKEQIWFTHLYHPVQKFTPPALNVLFPSGASVNVFTFYNSGVWVLQFSSEWKDGSQNHKSLLDRCQICRRCWKTKEFVGLGGFFWRTAGNWTALGCISQNTLSASRL